jgi:hypothetical protein
MGSSIGIAGCTSDAPGGNGGSGETDPETETDEPTEEAEPASFEVVSYDIPDTVQIGDVVSIQITIKNTGGQVGDFSEPLYIRTSDSDWQEGGEWSLNDVPPGESATMRSHEPITFDYIERYEFRLGDSSKTGVLQTVSAKIPWGEEYKTPEGYRIRVDSPTFQDTYQYENYQGNIEEAEPESGGQWAFVNVWVKNETGQMEFSPLASEFGLLYGNSQSDGETILFDDPVNKGEPFDGGELQPGVERSGWIAFELPDSVGSDDVEMAWGQETFEGQIAARWTSQ